MKRTLFLCAAATLFLVQCSVFRKPAAPEAAAVLPAATARWSDATLVQLENGRSVYYGECTKCHGPKSITAGTEEKWLADIDNMAPKAKLSDGQKSDLTRYVLAARTTLKEAK